MNAFLQSAQVFLNDDDGPTAVEYAVVVALIIISCIGAVTAFGGAVAGWFNGAAPTITGLPTS
ncbi:MAG: Flp family type IVb pilin [Candidatus Hinthialibacter antarcticus]|nr:Flp family type IVb pilin [Candidatus Hinthialibacter antarcticus]